MIILSKEASPFQDILYFQSYVFVLYHPSIHETPEYLQ